MVLKPVKFVGSSRKDICGFPDAVKDDIGYALYEAQNGAKPRAAKPLKGFGGAGVLEIVEECSGGTYRAVYTVRFPDVLYVLHCFQKKSRHGIKTPEQDIELIRRRLKAAEEDHAAYYKRGG